jgi:nitrogen regulatory protein P-II 2
VTRPMKLVTATVRPRTIDDIIVALTRVGVRDVSVTENRDYSQKGDKEIYRGMEFTPSFLSMLKVEVLVPEDRVETVVNLIGRAAQTGQPGSGKIVVLDVEHLKPSLTSSDAEAAFV